MPRLQGYRERVHQPIYDTLVRTMGDPTPAIQNSARLFGNAVVGDLGRTNMTAAGQLASDQTFVALALRVWLYFDGTNARTNYQGVASQLYWTLVVGQKPMFQVPCWYLPAGGGIWGFDGANPTFNLGTPEQGALLKLARPIIIPVRQNFYAQADWFAVGTNSALNLINTGATDDQKVIMYVIDGLQTRDVQ